MSAFLISFGSPSLNNGTCNIVAPQKSPDRKEDEEAADEPRTSVIATRRITSKALCYTHQCCPLSPSFLPRHSRHHLPARRGRDGGRGVRRDHENRTCGISASLIVPRIMLYILEVPVRALCHSGAAMGGRGGGRSVKQVFKEIFTQRFNPRDAARP